jgi:diguanylate cyclase (GGDEF)-like protein
LARRNDRQTAVLFIDLDQFKGVNDTLGHTAGDTLLKEFSARLRSVLRTEDFVARMGGDEFLVILANITGPERILKVVNDIQWRLKKPLHLEVDVVISASTGIARYPDDGADVETLIMNADTAMYQAKRAGRATHSFFSTEMHVAAEARLRLDSAMRHGIDSEEFVVLYQPIVSRRGTVVAAEALVRWKHADGSLLAPSEFIPHAEESGMIVALGRSILRTACLSNARWNCAAATKIRVNVNVSPKELLADDFLGSVFETLATSGMPPGLLEIELTETGISDCPQRATDVVNELRRAGVRIALDDFGTGYNSLVNLRTLQLDALKIDKCFIDEIEHNPVDQAIASAVVAAARSLGARAIAEGVETAEQSAFLQRLDINEMQGFHFGKPMTGDEFERLLLAQERSAAA